MLKVLLKRRKPFYIYEDISIVVTIVYIYIYICVKSIAIVYVEFTKKIILFSLFTPQFFIQKFISILHLKWTGINKGEEVKNLKFWVNILFEWPQSFFPATKIYILTFNLTHSLISLMGSFHFPQWKIFFPIHW